MAARPTTPATLAAALAAATISLTGCSSSTDNGNTSSDSNPSTASASHDKDAPTLQPDTTAAVTGELPSGTRTVLVPGPETSGLNITSTPLTTGTLDVKAADGKRYSAPDGYALTAVMIRAADEGEKTRDGQGGLSEYAKPITLTVNAGGKNTTVATIHGSDLAGGKSWIIPVPNKGDGAHFTMATDGGQQVVDLASGKRVDADSNGISLTTKLNAPVASSTACDTATTPPATSDGITLSGPLTCKVGWHLSDHITGAGWAPKGGALLIADGSLTLPQGTIKRGNSSLDEQQYTGAENLTLTGALDGQQARYAEAKANSWAGTRMRVVYALNPGQAPSKASLNASWTGKPGFMAQDGFPASIHLSAPATLTSTTPTSLTVKTGGTRE